MCTITNVLYVFVCYLCAVITVNFTIVVNLQWQALSALEAARNSALLTCTCVSRLT